MYRLSAQQTEIVDRVAMHCRPRHRPAGGDRRSHRGVPAPVSRRPCLGGVARPDGRARIRRHGRGPAAVAAVLDKIAQRCASTAMVYLMHLCGVACYSAAPDKTAPLLRAAADGQAPEHARVQRARLAQPLLGAGQPGQRSDDGRVPLSAEKSFVTSAGQADGYVVSTLSSRRDAADREHALSGPARRRGRRRGRAVGAGWACAATPARR